MNGGHRVGEGPPCRRVRLRSGAAVVPGEREQLSLWISFSHPRTQHIKAIKKSSAQRGDFEGKYECKDTAFLDQRGEIAEGKLNTAGMSIRNRLIPREFFFSFRSLQIIGARKTSTS